MNTMVFLLLLLLFALLIYLFATKDNPFIPNSLKPRAITSKQEVINWWGFRGPMFTEDFANTNNSGDFGDIGTKNYTETSSLMNYPTNETSEPGLETGIENFGSYLLNPNQVYSNDPYNDEQTLLSSDNNKYAKDQKQCHLEAYGKCRSTNQATSERKYENEFWNCSYKMKGPKGNDLGNFKQCTNNNLNTPNQLKCASLGRWDFDTCNPEDRVSHVCYKRNYDKCMANRGHKN